MRNRLTRIIALMLIFSFVASCHSMRSPWRRHRFNAHSNRGGHQYWYNRGT